MFGVVCFFFCTVREGIENVNKECNLISSQFTDWIFHDVNFESRLNYTGLRSRYNDQQAVVWGCSGIKIIMSGTLNSYRSLIKYVQITLWFDINPQMLGNFEVSLPEQWLTIFVWWCSATNFPPSSPQNHMGANSAFKWVCMTAFSFWDDQYKCLDISDFKKKHTVTVGCDNCAKFKEGNTQNWLLGCVCTLTLYSGAHQNQESKAAVLWTLPFGPRPSLCRGKGTCWLLSAMRDSTCSGSTVHGCKSTAMLLDLLLLCVCIWHFNWL